MKYVHDVAKHQRAQHIRTSGASFACSRSIFPKEFGFIGTTQNTEPQARMEHCTHGEGQTA